MSFVVITDIMNISNWFGYLFTYIYLSVCVSTINQLITAWDSISVYNQPPSSTQPGHPSVGRRSNEYQPKSDDALLLESKSRYGSWIVSGWQVKLWVPWHHGYLSTLAMGSSHNRALYKCPITLTLTADRYITKYFGVLHCCTIDRNLRRRLVMSS